MFSKIRRAFRRGTGLLWLSISLPSAMLAQTPILTFDTLTIGNAGQVSFTAFLADRGASSAVAGEPVAGEQRYLYRTDDNRFVISVNPDTISSAPRYKAFTFEVKVRNSAPSDAAWHVYEVRADPIGKFPDVLANVGFRLRVGKSESAGFIRLPIHSAVFDADLVRKNVDLEPLQVKVSDPHGPEIVLQNVLENLDIHITKVEVKSGCHDCWDEVIASPVDILARPSAKVNLLLNTRPKPLGALLSTAFLLKKETPQDVLFVTLGYNVDQGGMPKEKQINVPIRFTPSIWQLAMAVIVGGIVGAILKCLLNNDAGKITWKLLGQAVLLALVAESLAVMAASFDSKVIILNFDMDPRQAVPALTLAFVITGGPTVTKWALRTIQEIWTDAATNHAAEPGVE